MLTQHDFTAVIQVWTTMCAISLVKYLKVKARYKWHNQSEGAQGNRVRGRADTMEPIWKSMHNDLFAAPVLHVDGPPIRALKSRQEETAAQVKTIFSTRGKRL